MQKIIFLSITSVVFATISLYLAHIFVGGQPITILQIIFISIIFIFANLIFDRQKYKNKQ
jgi:hypothetical protein